MNKDFLNKLPQAVQARMDEVGLRDTLETLFGSLSSDDIPEEVCADVVEVLDWTLIVFATASGPLLQDTFNTLNTNFSRINQNLADRLPPAEDNIGSILQALSNIPGTRSVHSLETADRVNDRLKNARRNLADSETRFQESLEEAENDFTEFLDTHRSTVSQKVRETSDKVAEVELSTTSHHAELSEKMENLLQDLRERYGFTAEQVLGGAHESAANAEHELAESHSRRSRWSMWGAVLWAGLLQVAWLFGLTPDWVQWFDAARTLPIVGSPVVILLFVAKREGHVASEHRARHERLQSLALQFKSWEPYVTTLSEGVRPELERDITPKLFTGDFAASVPFDS